MAETKLVLEVVEYEGTKHLMAMEAETLRWAGTLGPVEEWNGRLVVKESGHSTEAVAALVEEMSAKGYDQMKARVLTAIEAAIGQADIGIKPLGRQIGYALDDAKRVMMDILARRAPEITPELLKQAGEARRNAEYEAMAATQTEFLEDEVAECRMRLKGAERRLAENRDRRLRMEIHDVLQHATPEKLEQVAGQLRKELSGLGPRA